jgi:hypothetical protein
MRLNVMRLFGCWIMVFTGKRAEMAKKGGFLAKWAHHQSQVALFLRKVAAHPPLVRLKRGDTSRYMRGCAVAKIFPKFSCGGSRMI